jgi:hypothetical protein
MSAALPKPIKQLQRSLTAGIAGKASPDLPMTHQQAHDMTVGAQRDRPGQSQDSLHQLGEALECAASCLQQEAATSALQQQAPSC